MEQTQEKKERKPRKKKILLIDYLKPARKPAKIKQKKIFITLEQVEEYKKNYDIIKNKINNI